MKILRRVIPLLLAAAVIFVAACAVKPLVGKKLNDGKVGTEYSDSIATGTKNMYYDLDYDSELPKGLILYDDGSIKGVPEQAGEFTFKAVMIDLNDNEYYADFTMSIAKGSLNYTAVELKDGKTGEPYIADIATATGMPNITYAVKEGSTLPAGLNLSPSGELSGIPSQAADSVTFTIVASAEGCDPVEATYTVKIEQGEHKEEDLGKIVFEDFALPDGLVGDEYSQNIGRAYGVPNITYKVRFTAGAGLPAGLKANNDLGIISGTPTDSTDSQIRFRVIASAEGCEDVTAYVTLNVFDKYVAATRFETEYVDTVNKLSGAGYSSAPSGRGMIQRCPLTSNGAVLGYLNKPATVIYKITSAQATQATLTLGLGSEVGNYVYDSDMFEIRVNGVKLDYGTISVTQVGTQVSDFRCGSHTVTPKVNLKEGENIIEFEIKASDKATGTFSAVGCLFDYIELTEASCEIGWRPRLANM